MTAAVRYSVRGRIALVQLDHPPVNALSQPLRAAVAEALAAALADPSVGALVICAAGSGFSGGGDLSDPDAWRAPPRLVDLIGTLESASKPTVAALHGRALGGGFELALACHFRVAAVGTRVGLPEVKLGLIPGAGGAQRLPRLIGVDAALPVILEGRELEAARALALGALDEIVEGDLVRGAIGFAERVLAEARPLRRMAALEARLTDPSILEQAARTMSRRQHGQLAPPAALEAVRRALELPLAQAQQRDDEACSALLQGPQSRALRCALVIERAVARPPSLPAGTAGRALERAAVVGTGTMAVGVAAALLNAEIPVTLHGRSAASLARARESIRQALAPAVARGALTEAQLHARLARLAPTLEYADLASADLVIENVSENFEVKREVFAALDRHCRPGAILASNTSFLDLNAIAAATGRPADVIGLHFFNPAHVMRLLECVRTRASAPDALATALQLGHRLGKVSVLVGACEGFVGNRMVSRRTREALFMVEEGATPWQVDRALVEFGFPLGPFAVNDLGGIDVVLATRKARFASLTPRERACDLFDRLIALGRLGRKSGAGWYRYDEQRQAVPDAGVEELIARYAAERGIARRSITDQEIVERCLFALVNEGTRLIEEGVVSRPHEIDAIWLHGFGLAAHRGGPMFQADELGLPQVLEGLKRYAAAVGPEYFTPAPLIERLAATGGRFYEG